LPISISIGVSVTRDVEETPDTLLQRADGALYDAKHSGRNCIRVAKADALPGIQIPPPATAHGAAA
jgi:two-component system, cell cycle response regulator